MQISVRLFAVLREAAGAADLVLQLPEGATVASLAEPLLARYPALGRHLPRVAFAVNRSYASRETPLHDGDEVALIPPVSGG